MNSIKLFKIPSFLFIVIVLLISNLSFTEEQPERAWRYIEYDRLGSNIYPYPSNPIGNLEENFKIITKELKMGDEDQLLLAGDVDGDSNLEICLSNYNDINIYSSKLNLVNTIRTDFETILGLLEDVDGDGYLDICVGKSMGHELKLIFFNYYGDTLLKIEEEGKFNSTFVPFCILADGDLIAIVKTGYGRLPRGIIRYDGRSGVRKWYYEIGSGISTPSIVSADIGEDGLVDFAINTFSPENGAVGYGRPSGGIGTYDDCSYTIVIDENGKERYNIRESAKFNNGSFQRFVQFGEDAPLKLLCWSYLTNLQRPFATSKIFIRDARSGNLENVFYGKAKLSFQILACDINNDGVKEVIASNYNERIFSENDRDVKTLHYILDNDLNILKFTCDIPGVIKYANDINGDGRPEFIFQSSHDLIITDCEFTEIWRRCFNKRIYSNIIIVDADFDGYNEIYLSTTSAIYSISVVHQD